MTRLRPVEIRDRTLRLALQHLSHRDGRADREEYRRIYQPRGGDTLVDGMVARGFAAFDRGQVLHVTDAGRRALADAEWCPL